MALDKVSHGLKCVLYFFVVLDERVDGPTDSADSQMSEKLFIVSVGGDDTETPLCCPSDNIHYLCHS